MHRSPLLLPLLLFQLCALLCSSVHAQLGIIQSISSYSSCTQSPLAGQVAQNPNTNATQAGNSVCSVFGQTETITVIRVRLTPLRTAGVQNLVLRVPAVPPVGQTYDMSGASDTQQQFACAQVPVGGQCLVPSQPLILTFTTTGAFAGYDATLRPSAIPSCYVQNAVPNWNQQCGVNDTVCQNFLTNVIQGSTPLPYYGGGQNCDTVTNPGGVNQVNPNLPESYGLSVQNACPQADQLPESVAPFYDAPSESLSTSPYCYTTYCKIPSHSATSDADTWTVSYTYDRAPLCGVYDLASRPRTVMAAEVVLAQASYEGTQNGTFRVIERMQVSTDLGQLPRVATTAPIVAQLINVNKGLGIIANNLGPSALVMCNSGGPSNSNGALDDMPGLVPPTDPAYGVRQQYYNPWRTANPVEGGARGRAQAQRCTLPVSACRTLMLPPWYRNLTAGGADAQVQGNWYFVTMQRLPEYASQTCNKNGINLQLLTTNALLPRICGAQALSFNGVAGQCIPGYEQRDQTFRTATPTDVSLFWSSYLARLSASAAVTGTPVMQPLDTSQVPAIDFVPSDYVPLNPSYWVNNGPTGPRLMRDALGGDSVSLDVLVVTALSFQGQVNSISVGNFVRASMSCDATTSSGGQVSFATVNRGEIGGAFLVAVTFQLPPGGTTADLQAFLTEATINIGGEVLKVQSIGGEWGPRSGPNGIIALSFDYTYTGPLRNSIEVLLQLYVPAGVQGGYVLVDELVSGCTITRGVVQDLAGKGREGDDNFVVDLSKYRVCIYWYENLYTCWGHYDETWKLVVSLIVYITVFLIVLLAAGTAIALVISNWFRADNNIKAKLPAPSSSDEFEDEDDQYSDEDEDEWDDDDDE